MALKCKPVGQPGRQSLMFRASQLFSTQHLCFPSHDHCTQENLDQPSTGGQEFALYRAYSMIIRTTDFVGRRLVCACTYVHVLSMHKTGNCLMIVDFLQLQMCEMEK